jgi:hypothetical protein
LLKYDLDLFITIWSGTQMLICDVVIEDAMLKFGTLFIINNQLEEFIYVAKI